MSENKHEDIYGNLKVIQNAKGEWGIETLDGNIVVPYGKYDWISGFDSGLARVNIKHKTKIEAYDPENGHSISCFEVIPIWGIINEQGEEVLSVEYDNVWNFLGKGRNSTRVEKDGQHWLVYLYDLNPNLPHPQDQQPTEVDDDDDYGNHYGDFAGTYAQDVAGFSDDAIYDAFDGDADAYWNID